MIRPDLWAVVRAIAKSIEIAIPLPVVAKTEIKYRWTSEIIPVFRSRRMSCRLIAAN